MPNFEVLKKSTLKQGESEVPIMETAFNYFNLTGATTLGKKNSSKAVTLVPTDTGLRTRLSAQLWSDLGNPEQVEVLQLNDKVIIIEARTKENALNVKKGRYIYSTEVAKAIAKLAEVDFNAQKENGEPKSISVGSYEIQPVDENISGAVISFN